MRAGRRTCENVSVSDHWLEHGHETNESDLTPVFSSSSVLAGGAGATPTRTWTSGWRAVVIGGGVALLATLGVVGVANAISDNLFPSMGSTSPASVWQNPVPPSDPAPTTVVVPSTAMTVPSTTPPTVASTAPTTVSSTPTTAPSSRTAGSPSSSVATSISPTTSTPDQADDDPIDDDPIDDGQIDDAPVDDDLLDDSSGSGSDDSSGTSGSDDSGSDDSGSDSDDD
jgi:hypothetical protein